MVGTITAIAFIVEFPIMPSIIIAIIVATIISAASENTVRRLAFSLLRKVVQDGCANKNIKESHENYRFKVNLAFRSSDHRLPQ